MIASLIASLRRRSSPIQCGRVFYVVKDEVMKYGGVQQAIDAWKAGHEVDGIRAVESDFEHPLGEDMVVVFVRPPTRS
jgi:hypothetical protein